jgi:predicted DsbA family dithiol-disulfide isomerase
VEAEANQLQQEKLNVGRFSVDALVAAAKHIGLDQGAFATCLESPATLQTVEDDFNAARAAGLRGTPGFVLNGTAVAYPNSVVAFRQLLDAAIKK